MLYLLCIGSGPFGTLLLLTMKSLEFDECKTCLCMLTNFKCLETTFIGAITVLLVCRFTEIARNINQMTPKDSNAPRSNLLQLITPPTPISSPLLWVWLSMASGGKRVRMFQQHCGIDHTRRRRRKREKREEKKEQYLILTWRAWRNLLYLKADNKNCSLWGVYGKDFQYF